MIDRRAIKEKKQRELRYCAICLIDAVEQPVAGSELHELIPRSITIGNEEARERSYAEELTVILCHNHHQDNHIQKKRTNDLRAYNERIYGKERVRAAYDHLQAAMKSRIGWVFE